MPPEKDCLIVAVIRNENEVSDEASSLQVVIEEVTTTNSVSMQHITDEVTNENSVSILGRKRTYSEVEINAVSTSPKRARTTSSSEKSANDHSYCIKSPRRARRQVDYLIDTVGNLKKRLKSSQKKTKRRDRKVSMLASVVSELKEKNLINSDCAALLETTFSGVPRELTKRAKVLAEERDNQEVVCTLMLDEMSIRKHVEWDGKQFRGYVDLGTGINDDSLPEATTVT
ncbi:THAP domain-containing 9 [Paramuricea clavata]|uniref:THAP domain-containing 9, partial n=1 Tax=Paramuricea clavata TaxID=317549 RepID=A0A7D9IT48_PARCT|nr:THAP domain-containing 9 [Paramuricea clavata]